MKQRYLTKSKFKLAMECPTKLFYSSKSQYANKKSEDSFLIALAEGGFQVGELAKYYYRENNPINLQDFSDDDAVIKTKELLKNDDVVIFEAAVLFRNLFLRADILIKKNDQLRFVEVKSKSADFGGESPFMKKKGGILSGWRSYIYDVAFQKYVLSMAYPDYGLSSFLMLVDKTSICPADGLNQKFKIAKDDKGCVTIIVSDGITSDDLSQQLLREINVDAEIEYIFKNEKFKDAMTFKEYIAFLSDKYLKDEEIFPVPGSMCGKCEFRTSVANELSLKSGFKECWTAACGFSEEDFSYPTVLDISGLTGDKKDKLIQARKFRMAQVAPSDINPIPRPNGELGYSDSERRWIQIKKAKDLDDTCEIDHGGLKREIETWTYPFHFIDFETVAPAIPFNKGAHPYQGVAFQFSHHILRKDGSIEHAGQYINTKVGINPNIDFITALMGELSKDNGTIFRYGSHENTYLNIIYNQIVCSKEESAENRKIIDFIKLISSPTHDSRDKWDAVRLMVDLCDLVKKYYYDPRTNGSNSIKKVFPSILSRSVFLQNKYGKPIYGSSTGIKSMNFVDMQWLQIKDNVATDPYSLLPPLFSDLDVGDIELLFDDETLKEGGSASIAYSRMQFTEMSEIERQELIKALLKYCELDKLAMVMIVEEWMDFSK